MKSLNKNKRSSNRKVISSDVDLTPIMCLFIILVPLLLLSAVFEQLAALKVYLPPASTLAEVTDGPQEISTGIVELRLLILENSLQVEATLSHDPSGQEKKVYEDIQHQIPIKGDKYDLEVLQQILKGLKQEYPRHEEIVFLVDDKVSYNVIVQAMDACKNEIFIEEDKKKERPLFPAIALSDAFSEEGGYDGLRKGTRDIDKKLGIP